jgi:hypothetical protein
LNLRAGVDQAAWLSRISMTSTPFCFGIGLARRAWATDSDPLAVARFFLPQDKFEHHQLGRLLYLMMATVRLFELKFGDAVGTASRGDGGEMTARAAAVTRVRHAGPLVLALSLIQHATIREFGRSCNNSVRTSSSIGRRPIPTADREQTFRTTPTSRTQRRRTFCGNSFASGDDRRAPVVIVIRSD